MKYFNFILKKPIRSIFLFFCAILFYFFALRNSFVNTTSATGNVPELSVFVQDGCVHCLNAEKYLSTKPFGDQVNVVYYNLKDKKNIDKLRKEIERLSVPTDSLGTPIFIIKDDYILGFGEEIKEELNKLVEKWKTN
jgi:glutaredoxin